MQLIADIHTHSVACNHAYSTIEDNARTAAERGLRYLGLTEHACTIPGAPAELYFWNLKVLPDRIAGVLLLRGVEVNVMDYCGGFDLPRELLQQLDLVIASMHNVVLTPGSAEEHTECWRRVARDPDVDIIGHCNVSDFPCDYDAVVRAFKEGGKVVELNAHHALEPSGAPKKNTDRMMEACRKYEVPVVVNSDAHYRESVGNFSGALSYLAAIGFPEKLVLNADEERFTAFIREKSERVRALLKK